MRGEEALIPDEPFLLCKVHNKSLSRVKPEASQVKKEKETVLKSGLRRADAYTCTSRQQRHAAATVPEPTKTLTFLRVSPGGCSGVEKSIVGIWLLAEDTPTFRTAIITLRTTVNNRNHLSHCSSTHTDPQWERCSSHDLHMNVRPIP